MFGKLQEGKRSRGASKTHWGDSLKTTLKTLSIDHDTWELETKDRYEWRAAQQRGAKSFEEMSSSVAEQRRLTRIGSAAKSPLAPTVLCPNCLKVGLERSDLCIRTVRTTVYKHKNYDDIRF